MNIPIILFLLLVIVVLVGVIIYLKSNSNQHSQPFEAPGAPIAVLNPEEGPSDSSLRDPITNLYNRKQLLRRLQEFMARCDRGKDKMVLVLWDIDGFNEFNNHYGQNQGDEFLKKVADTVRKSVRIYDEAFRSGSDEFCAILCPADEKIASEVTRRVSEVVSRKLFDSSTEYANEQFSISFGLVTYPSEHKVPEALLYAAGQKLYKARTTTT